MALELAVWGATADALAFLDPPPPTALADATELLGRLGAIDDAGRPTPTGRTMVDLPLHPRLARMVTDERSALAVVLATLLEERDPLRGRPEELDADVTERIRLVTDPRRGHPRLDDGARRTARRRAQELARRAGIGFGDVDPSRAGPVLALAYPDRIAQARGRGRFLLRSGRAVALAPHDPLAAEAFIVVADLAPPAPREVDDRVRLAAALDEAEVEAVAGTEVRETTELAWNARDELEQRARAAPRRVGPGPGGRARPRRGRRRRPRSSTGCGTTASACWAGPRRPARFRSGPASPGASSATRGRTSATRPSSPAWTSGWLPSSDGPPRAPTSVGSTCSPCSGGASVTACTSSTASCPPG